MFWIRRCGEKPPHWAAPHAAGNSRQACHQTRTKRNGGIYRLALTLPVSWPDEEICISERCFPQRSWPKILMRTSRVDNKTRFFQCISLEPFFMSRIVWVPSGFRGLLYHFIQFGQGCDMWHFVRNFGFGHLPKRRWQGSRPLISLFSMGAHQCFRTSDTGHLWHFGQFEEACDAWRPNWMKWYSMIQRCCTCTWLMSDNFGRKWNFQLS